MAGKHHVSDGDWVCDNETCGNVNFAWRTECNRCGAGKTRSKIKDMGVAIGKQMAEKSHGLFSEDDWQCKTCGNVNWARRADCNVCKMPKVGKVESRTGYGGGFNERENVEYNKREDSDDEEFDDFGRKKKTFRGKLPEPAPPPLDKNSPIKNDDEEDDEDDGDLDAYKLDSDEDEDNGDTNQYKLSDEEDKEKQPEATVTSKTSRSTSRSSSSRSRRSSSSSSHGSRSSSPKRSKSRSRSSSSRSSRSRSHSRSDSRSRKRRRSSSQSRSRSRSGSSDQYEPKKRR